MRKLMLILTLSTFFLQMHAQNFVSEVPALDITESTDSNFVVHTDYLNSVKSLNTPSAVLSLQKNIARFDIITEDSFDGREEVFEVAIKGEKGKIYASIASDGTIQSTTETYKNIALPKEIRSKLSKEYGRFKQVRNQLSITYEHGLTPKYCYKVVVQADGKRKALTFDGSAN